METCQDMEQLGYHVRGTYRGPFSWEYCLGLVCDLRQAKCEDGSPAFTPGSLHIVSQGKGYNVVYTLTEQEYQLSQQRKV